MSANLKHCVLVCFSVAVINTGQKQLSSGGGLFHLPGYSPLLKEIRGGGNSSRAELEAETEGTLLTGLLSVSAQIASL